MKKPINDLIEQIKLAKKRKLIYKYVIAPNRGSDGDICWSYTLAIMLHNTKNMPMIRQRLVNHISQNYCTQSVSQSELTVWINY